MNKTIIVYMTKKELYEHYVKHHLYDYPIKCKVCLSYVKLIVFNSEYSCLCRTFKTAFPLGISFKGD